MSKKPNDSNILPIRIIKLRNGETLIARCKKIDAFYVMREPMLMVYIPCIDKEGVMSNTNIAFRDWIEGSTVKEYHIPADAVLIDVDCEPTIQMMYEKIVLETEKEIYFEEEYLDETIQFYDNSQDKPKKKKKPKKPKDDEHEKLDDDDDLDTNGWDDYPPRFKT